MFNENICEKVFKIVTNRIYGDKIYGEGSIAREIIDFKGCYSLKNFINHLKRTNSQDFDIDMINKYISKCTCQPERLSEKTSKEDAIV